MSAGERERMQEKRVSTDGYAYTRAEYLAHFGGAHEWNSAPVETRYDRDGRQFRSAELQHSRNAPAPQKRVQFRIVCRTLRRSNPSIYRIPPATLMWCTATGVSGGADPFGRSKT